STGTLITRSFNAKRLCERIYQKGHNKLLWAKCSDLEPGVFMKITKIYKKLFGSLLIVVASLPLISSAATTQPAQFGDAINELSSKVTLPDVFQGGFKTVAVYCQTDVAAT